MDILVAQVECHAGLRLPGQLSTTCRRLLRLSRGICLQLFFGVCHQLRRGHRSATLAGSGFGRHVRIVGAGGAVGTMTVNICSITEVLL